MVCVEILGITTLFSWNIDYNKIGSMLIINDVCFLMIKYRKAIILCLVLIIYQPTLGQNTNISVQFTAEELIELHYKTLDSLPNLPYAKAYLKKVKLKNDDQKIVVGYYLLASGTTEDALKLKYSDSIINLTENEKSLSYYPAIAYLIKSSCYTNELNYKKALDNVAHAKIYGEKHQNEYILRRCRYDLGVINIRLGEFKKALQLFHKNLFISKKDTLNNDFGGFFLDWYALASVHNELKAIDSASYYNKIGLALAKKKERTINENYFMYNAALTNFHKGNYILSKNQIEQTLPFFKTYNDRNNILESYYYLGKIYNKLGNRIYAKINYKKIDSFYSENQKIYPPFRDAYYELIDLSDSEDERINKIDYINKLIKIDSLTLSSNLYLSNKIYNDFEIPKLIEEKKIIIKQLNTKNKSKNSKLIIAITSLIVLLLILTYQIYLKSIYKKRARQLVASSDTKTEKSLPKKVKIDIDISEIIINNTLENLTKFEKDLGFLNPELNLQTLAKNVKSNTKYVSKIINYHKESSYNNYINKLRIHYALKKLKEDKQFSNFTIQAIAVDSGFRQAESFTKAFKKETGVKPSYFINELKK